MAGLPPGDPQLVSMIVNHLKTQGLFDQFRRDCLADVDTKPAYLNLKQRVDNFVSNHLSNHTWSPHLNKNQLRNNIRQLVLQSGMLEQGVDRIVAQVVDPKINHTFRPQVERVVREFLSPGSYSDEPPLPVPYADVKPESSALEQVPSAAPPTTTASDAMSILDTITSLNQGASSWAGPSGEKGRKGPTSEEPMQPGEKGEHDMVIAEEGDHLQDGQTMDETEEAKLAQEIQAVDIKTEDSQVEFSKEEGEAGEVKTKEEETDGEEREKAGGQEQADEEKDKAGGRTGKSSAEKQDDDDSLKSPNQIRQKARERLKEEYSLEDSDLEGLSDITVSSVHTSDLSSFEEDSDEEQPLSESSEEGELPSDGEGGEDKEASADKEEDDKEQKPRRKAYVHKPFLYSRYYSDSDDEVTVEERRRCAAKDKEDRLLKRQQNRERMEERRKQKAAQAELQARRRQQRSDSPSAEEPQAKQARKERKVLEKKMALNRKRKLDSRKEGDTSSRKKSDSVGEGSKRELKSAALKTLQPKPIRKESHSLDERSRRHSGSVSEDSSEPKKISEKSRTHSFILELEQGSQEVLKHRPGGKFDRHSRKDSVSKERKEKDRSVSDERAKPKQKPEKIRAESQTGETSQKEAPAVKTSFSEEKGEKKAKVKGEKKTSGAVREGRGAVLEGATDEGTSKDPSSSKKGKAASTDSPKVEKDKEGEKDRGREKVREKEKPKGEKNSTKSENSKVSLTPDISSASRAERGEVEADGAKKKEKPPKELLRRSKSCSEDRQGEKPKVKTEGKDGEREKTTKVDAEGQKSSKSSSEADKDPRRSKVTEKGKVSEKTSKLKVREDVKSPSSSKSEKKAPAEVKGKAVTPIGKHDTTKEKMKDGGAKEDRHAPEDPLQEKPEETRRTAKRKFEKGDKIPEKKDNDGPETKKKTTKGPQGDDKLEKAEASPLPSPVVEAEETPAKKPTLLQDASNDSDPAVAAATPTTTTATTTASTTATASPSDDTYDALSDITPEPDEGETEARLRDLEGQPGTAPSAADPLLTLVDICTSVDAMLTRDPPQAPVVADAEEADMKMMTEAALTLLSMDPESTVSACVLPPPPPPPAHTTEDLVPQEEAPAAGDAGEGVKGIADNAPPVAGVEPETDTAEEPSPVSSDQVNEPEEKKTQSTDASDSSEKEPIVSREHTPPSPVPEADQTKSNQNQTPLSEEKQGDPEMEPEPPSVHLLSPSVGINAAEEAVTEHLKTKVNAETIPNTQVVCSEPLQTNVSEESENSSQPAEPKPDVVGAEVSTKEEEMEVGANQATVDVDNVAKVVQAVPEGEGVTKDSQNTVCDAPDQTQEVVGTKHQHKSKTVEETVSDSDKQEEEKAADLSQKDDKTEGRVTRKRRLSMQKSSSSKDSAEKEEKDGQEQPSVEETGEDKAPETKTPRRGRSSRTGPEVEEEEEQPREEQPKVVEAETPARRGRRPATQAQDTTTSTTNVQVKDEKKHEEKEETPLDQKESEDHGVLDAVETSDSGLTRQTGEPSKTEVCEDMQESAEETSEEVQTGDAQQEQEEKQHSPDTGDQSEDLEEGKPEGSSDNKTDVEEDQPRAEQEVTPKKPGRRGRPPKAAAAANVDSADKMEEKADESGLNTEEDEDEEEGDSKSRTTRSASRMEAERNKPSKPSTRASRHSGGKEESSSGTARGTRGQAAGAKGARKREASPPVVRTRGGPKPEETPSKRSKR